MEEIKVLITTEKIENRIIEIANQIMRDYQDEELDLLCVLSGAAYFATDLSKQINNKQKIHFIKVSSYGDQTESSGTIKMLLDLKGSIENRNVIIIEDIVDSGRTLSYLKEHLAKYNPKSLRICSLLDKPSRRTVDINIDYLGFKIPDEFVIGYGLDYAEYYRNLNYIGYFPKK